MTIGTPQDLGTSDSGTTPATLVISTLQNIVAHDVIAVFHYGNTVSAPDAAISGVTDSGGNTYHQIVNQAGLQPHRDIWICNDATAFASGGSITATCSAGVKHGIAAVRVPGLLNAFPWDPHTGSSQRASAGTTTAVSISTNNYYCTNQCLLAAMVDGANPGVVTHGGSWTALNTAGTNVWIKTAYQIVSASAFTTNVTYAPTWVNSGPNTATISAGFIGNCSC